jgi:GT2 family glycosyltransferase
MKTSVLMTVHDREPEVLLATLRSLTRSGLSDSELIIVDDRSEMDYSWIKEYAKPRFKTTKWIPSGNYEGFRIEGYGNPSRAFNLGLEVATGERLVVMSSDVIATTKSVWSMDRFWNPDVLYTPRIVNMDTCTEYCGATRPFPMPWMLTMPTKTAQDIGGWDEAFLMGLCFEDNDFVGRMALKLGTVRCDWDATAYHQSHNQPAYDVTNEEVVAANARNRDICKRKWLGIPFDGEHTCWTMIKKPDPSGCIRLEVQNDSLKEQFFGVKV